MSRRDLSKVTEKSGKNGFFKKSNVIPKRKGLMIALDNESEVSSLRMNTGYQSFANSLWIKGIVRKNHDPWHALS